MESALASAVSALLGVLGIYLAIGIPVAIAFVLFGVGRVDPAARSGTIGFRVVILPGVVAFWPAMLLRWIKGSGADTATSASDGGEA